MAKKQNPRQQEILEAALQEFTKEGISGARLQAVANNIGVTKAMIHYYFDTKDKLFEEVFKGASETLMTGLMDTLEESMPLFKKIEAFIDRAVDRFSDKPELTGFVVNELNRHPEMTEAIFLDVCKYDASIFDEQIKEAASDYEIAPVNSLQVTANMLSLCMFPYCGNGFLQSIFRMEDDQNYEAFLEKRREVIKDTVINWLAG
jgi:AcrR family transcriptional regulator